MLRYLAPLTILVALTITGAPFAGRALALVPEELTPRDSEPFDAAMIGRIRQAATMIPGERPTTVAMVTVAESIRPRSEVIEGGTDAPNISARAAFQLVFPTGTVMIDSGMDETVHRFFGRGRPEPYFPEANAKLQQALKQASLILITHEHGDHVAGVIRSDARAQLAAKTLLTKEQVRSLTLWPQMPEIRLRPDEARQYRVVDFADLLPVAPGVVLIKAAGHTPGHLMVYVTLGSGAEFLFIGDIVWTMDGIREAKQKPRSQVDRIPEDPVALAQQIRWIKGLSEQERVTVVPSHDDRLLKSYVASGLIEANLWLP